MSQLLEREVISLQNIITPVTPDCRVSCECSSYESMDVNISFLFRNQIIWNPALSSGINSVTLPENLGNGIVTLVKGLTVTLSATSNSFSIYLTGTIIDNNTTYKIAGLLLGTFGTIPTSKNITTVKNVNTTNTDLYNVEIILGANSYIIYDGITYSALKPISLTNVASPMDIQFGKVGSKNNQQVNINLGTGVIFPNNIGIQYKNEQTYILLTFPGF